MSYFEECLKQGNWLFQDVRRALYRYLLEMNKELYSQQAIVLLRTGKLTRTIANGEAIYSIKNSYVSYSAHKLNSMEISSNIRQMRLTRIKFWNIRKLRKYFAQSDVDVIHNFPIQSAIPQEENGYGINIFPYYSLAYYSDGKNRLLGLIKKLKTDDKEILLKLRSL